VEPGAHLAVAAEDVQDRDTGNVPPRLLEGAPAALDHWVAVEWEAGDRSSYAVLDVQHRHGGALPRPL
jgi:hypothetical protein